MHDKSGHDYEQIEDAYMKALSYAKQAGKLQAVVGIKTKCVKLMFPWGYRQALLRRKLLNDMDEVSGSEQQCRHLGLIQ